MSWYEGAAAVLDGRIGGPFLGCRSVLSVHFGAACGGGGGGEANCCMWSVGFICKGYVVRVLQQPFWTMMLWVLHLGDGRECFEYPVWSCM